MKTKKTGFTLIELLVVISIIALLLSILVPSLSKARELAKRSVCSSQLKQISVAVMGYAMRYNGALLNVSLPNATNLNNEEFHPFVAYRDTHFIPGTTRLWAYRFGCLYENRLIEDPKVFYCPANKDESRRYESYTNPGKWGTLPQNYNAFTANQWVRVGYEYFPLERNPGSNYLRRGIPSHMARKFDQLDTLQPYMSDVLRTKNTMSHRARGINGVNVVYPDGSVVFCNKEETFGIRAFHFVGGSIGTSTSLWDIDPSDRDDATGKNAAYQVYYWRFVAISGNYPKIVTSVVRQ